MTTGNTMLLFTPQEMQISSSGNVSIGQRNGRFTAEFASGVNQSAFFAGVMPYQYGNNGLTVYLHYTMAQGSGNILWGVNFASYGAETNTNTIDTYIPANQLTVTSPSPSVLGQIRRDSIVFADGPQIGNLNGGDYFLMAVARLGASGLDTGYGNAQLLGVEVKET